MRQILVCFIALCLTGCAFLSPIRVRDVAISHGISVSNTPLEVVSIVLPHHSDIYASFYVEGISETTRIRADWVYIAQEDDEKVIESTEIALSEPKQVAFSVTKTKGKWPSGTYNVRIYVGEESHPRVINSFIVI